MFHPNDELFLAKLRQRELIASARTEQIRTPHRSVAPRHLPQLRAVWPWLRARVFTRRPA